MNKELKPCPFCGGEAMLITPLEYEGVYRVKCVNFNCDIRPVTSWFGAKEDAIERWNRRTTDE